YPHEHLLHRLVGQQAERTPEAEAVRFEGSALSYRELWSRSGLLARRLRALGVPPGAPVAVCLDRSPDLVVALLGVLRAGGAYAPLDPDYPAERLAMMLQDCRPPVLLTQPHLAGRLPDHSAQVISLQAGWGEHEQDDEGGGNLDEGLCPEH